VCDKEKLTALTLVLRCSRAPDTAALAATPPRYDTDNIGPFEHEAVTFGTKTIKLFVSQGGVDKKLLRLHVCRIPFLF